MIFYVWGQTFNVTIRNMWLSFEPESVRTNVCRRRRITVRSICITERATHISPEVFWITLQDTATKTREHSRWIRECAEQMRNCFAFHIRDITGWNRTMLRFKPEIYDGNITWMFSVGKSMVLCLMRYQPDKIFNIYHNCISWQSFLLRSEELSRMISYFRCSRYD